MRLGLFGLRADKRGLSSMTQDFIRHMKPDKVLGIDLGKDSPYPSHWENGTEVVRREALTPEFLKAWFSDVDSAWFAETGYSPETFPIAREMCHTMLHAMPELYPWTEPPTHIVANPTSWRMMPGGIRFPFPVDIERLRFKQRSEAKRFVHVAGHRAAHDRDGTHLLLQSLSFLKSPTEIVIYSRQPLNVKRFLPRSPVTLTVRPETEDSIDLYDGDVLVLPRRYGGQSLPMNEAMALGLPVISLDIEPQRGFLHPAGLVPASRQGTYRAQGGRVEVFGCDPRTLAGKMDDLHRNPSLVEEMSQYSGHYAESISWGNLQGRFYELLDKR